MLKNGKNINRSNVWTDSRIFKWNLSESGLYSIQAHIKRDGINTISFSYPALYLTETDKKDFTTFLKEGSTPPIFNDVFKARHPYTDFVIVSSNEDIGIGDRSKKFTELYSLTPHRIEGDEKTYIFSHGDQFKVDCTGSYVFSGSCFIENKLIFGSNDITNCGCILETHPVGNYTYLIKELSNNFTECGSDYFGNEKIYYIESDTLSMASNSYHLLLIMARDMGVPLSINVEKANATFALATLQPFQQNFSHDMDVSPICMLPVDKKLLISEGNIQLVDTQLTDVLSGRKTYNTEEYNDLLITAMQEILDNVKSVLQYPTFDHVIVDLTGGMDSRLVFNAVTHFPEYENKIRLNSQYSALEPDDLVVAQEIASLYDYQYDDLPREKFALAEDILGGQHWSYNLGAYYPYAPLPYASQIKNTARLNGAYGEICARPYYSRRMFGSEMDLETDAGFWHAYFAKHSKSALIPSKSAIKNLEKIQTHEFQIIPGNTPLEKFDNHYLYFRNGLHFSDRFRSYVFCPEFGPIQSKSLFAAKIMGYHKFKGAKTQFDIINLLNPQVASHRYESAFDNTDRESVVEKFGLLGEKLIKSRTVDLESISANWDQAKKNISQNITDERSSWLKFAERYRSFEPESVKIALTCLHFLNIAGIFSEEDVTKSIWLILSGKTDAPKSIQFNIINRIVSLYFQFQYTSQFEEDMNNLKYL